MAQTPKATAWAPHTVHGCFAGLTKQGHAVVLPEPIRQVGPDREGARGSRTVHQNAD